MKTITFTHIHVENFGKHTNIQHELGRRTIISGANEVGKSTIKRAIQYVLGTRDENGKEISGIRPHDENGVDIDGLITVAELGVSVDSLENTLKKTYFQKKNRDGAYTGENDTQYFIDDVKKGTKKAYDEFISGFLPSMVCISAQELLSKDTDSRRKIIEDTFSTHSNDDVIDMHPEYEELRAKLKANTVRELRKDLRKKRDGTTENGHHIDGLKDIREKVIHNIEFELLQKVDIDLAELKLQRNALNEQIASNKAKQADISKQFEEQQNASDGVLELKFELSDLQRKANEENNRKRREIEEEISSVDMSAQQHGRTIVLSNDKISSLERDSKRYEEEIKKCRDEYTRISKLVFDENSFVCSYCGQEYPADRKEQIRADFEQKKADDLAETTENGNGWKQRIKDTKAEIEKLKKAVEIATKQKELAEKWSYELEEELDKLPQSIDISEREDVKEINRKIAEKEQAMKEGNSASEIRQQLQEECESLSLQLAEVVGKMNVSVKNDAIDERVEQLRQEQHDLSQKIADIERELDLLKRFERKKAELLESDVNSNFEFVQFRMFEPQVNGDLKDVCLITVNGESYDRNLNFSNRLLAEVDICRGFQRKFDVQLPILLDNAENIDKDRIPNIPNQLILFERTDSKELRVEVIE